MEARHHSVVRSLGHFHREHLIRGHWCLILARLGLGEHLVLELCDQGRGVLLLLKGFLHVLLSLIVDLLDLIYLVNIENVVVPNFLEEFE